MKLIEAMKQVKSLHTKAEDLRKKVCQHSAYLSVETPVYKEQAKQVAEWLQAHESIMQEIGALQVRIAKTNLATEVTITLGGKQVIKSITEWIVRRGNGREKNGTAMFDFLAWSQLTDRNLKEGNIASSQGSAPTEVKIVRCYDPLVRDEKLAVYRVEATTIDAALEVTNAVTDLLE